MIEVKNLTKRYGKNRTIVKALNGVNFTLPDKGLVFIVGKSGSGKSTLLNLICGLDDATSGSIFVNGSDICALKPHELDNYRNYFVGIIYQHFNLFEEDTVINNIKLASDIAENKVEDDEIFNIIKKLDLEGKEKSLVRELSGGQKQRVAIARALIKDPHMIVADEPTGNLDSKTSKLIFDIFREISKEKLVVIVSHDMENARTYADRLIEIADGQIISDCERNESFVDLKNIVVSKSSNFSEDELSKINEVIKESGLKITNTDDRFVPFEKEVSTNEEKTDFKGRNRSWKNSLRLSLKFLKSAWISLVIAVLLSSLLIGLLVLSDEFSSFDGEQAMGMVADKYNFEFVIYNKGYSYVDSSANINSKYAIGITDGDINKFKDAGYTGDIYPVYATPIYNGSYFLENSEMLDDSKIKNIYIEEAYGTMVVTMEYLNKIFNGVEVIAGSLYGLDESTSLIITDYFADALLARGVIQRADYLSIYTLDSNDIYQNLLGARISDRYSIGAIVKTNYKEKYKWLFKMFEKLQLEKQNADIISKELYSSDLFGKFMEDVKGVLGMTYSINPNFIEDYCSTYASYFRSQGLSVYDDNDQLLEAYSSSEYNYINQDLLEGEIIISNTRFNSFFPGQEFTIDGDFYITLKQYGYEQNSHELPKLEKKMKVVGLFTSAEETEYVHYYLSSADAYAFMLNAYPRYALCFDDITQLTIINKVANENYFYTGSTAFTAIANLIDIVKIFSEIFSYIAIVLIIIIAMFIVFHNLRVIKNNQYRLGVYKSLGYSSLALGESTLLNSVYLIVLILILSVIISASMAGTMNSILTASFAKYLSNELYANLILVNFSMPLILKYVGIVLGITVVSTFIPIISIRKIKPNIIINKAD